MIMTGAKVTFICSIDGEKFEFELLKDIRETLHYEKIQSHLSDFDKKIKLAAVRQLLINEVGEEKSKNIDIQCVLKEKRREPSIKE
jgi:hypothetical protein